MNRFKEKGISHRTVHLWMVIIIVIFSGTIVFSTFRLMNSFLRVNSATKQYSELQSAAQDLMNASDYLTEQVQRFTVSGDVTFMNNYFYEAFEEKRREKAIAKMDMGESTKSALEKLKQAMDSSVKLMDQEYYAMRLVIEAKGYTDYPSILNEVQLSSEDAALSDSEKMQLATTIVLNDLYYLQKDKIRSDMAESIDEIEKLAETTEEKEFAILNREIRIARFSIIAQALLIFLSMGFTTRLGISPVLNAIECIKAGAPLPETGSSEFRYLANAYNKMYQKNLKSLEALNYKASHDELTGVYNRAGYDYLLKNLDLKTTYMMLFDVDNFKVINDTFGHETGDHVLMKFANTLKNVFRDDDCICRIGGDEFVVFMVHSGGMQRRLIESKIQQVNEDLEKTDDGLPPISISVGIVNGKDVTDTSKIFEKTDKALYESKTHGKHTYTFYSD